MVIRAEQVEVFSATRNEDAYGHRVCEDDATMLSLRRFPLEGERDKVINIVASDCPTLLGCKCELPVIRECLACVPYRKAREYIVSASCKFLRQSRINVFVGVER